MSAGFWRPDGRTRSKDWCGGPAGKKMGRSRRSPSMDPSRVAPFIYIKKCWTPSSCLLWNKAVLCAGGREGAHSLHKTQRGDSSLKQKPPMLGDKVVQTRPTFKKKRRKEREEEKTFRPGESAGILFLSWEQETVHQRRLPHPPPPLLTSLANSSLHYLTREQKIVRNIWKRNNVSLWYEGG